MPKCVNDLPCAEKTGVCGVGGGFTDWSNEAHFAEAVRPEVLPLPDAATQELAVLVARRRQLMEMRVAEQNRSRGTPARIRAQIREHVDWLNRQTKATS
jgi:transposase